MRPAGAEYDRTAWHEKQGTNWDGRATELLGTWRKPGDLLLTTRGIEAARRDRETAERNILAGIIKSTIEAVRMAVCERRERGAVSSWTSLELKMGESVVVVVVEGLRCLVFAVLIFALAHCRR